MQDILPDSRAVRHGTTAAVLLVAVIAAIVSFVHIEHLAVTHGQIMLAALLLPVSIDGTVAAASLVMLRAARAGLGRPWLARVMLGLSVIATLAANIAYGAHYGLTGSLLSGWPAVAFIGSAEMALGMVRRTREQNTVAVGVADPVPTNPSSRWPAKWLRSCLPTYLPHTYPSRFEHWPAVAASVPPRLWPSALRTSTRM